MADTRSECWGDNTSARLLRGFLFCGGRRLRDPSREGVGSTGPVLTLQPKIPTKSWGSGGGVSIDFCLILTRRAQQQITRRATTLWPLGTLL